jgi:signal transduction protein with GAF and PtsI domain
VLYKRTHIHTLTAREKLYSFMYVYMYVCMCVLQGKGLAGAVAQDSKPLNIIDAYDDPRFNRYTTIC